MKRNGWFPFSPATVVTFSLSALALGAAEPVADSKDLPRVPAVEPANALSTFQVKPGFHLDLVASEPLVVDPVAMCFDEDGRLFVAEMRDYSERRNERLGRIRMLVDTDGDGRFDKSTIFAENLPWPTALFWYAGGLFVGATPDIWYFKDTDNDGVADEKKLVFTGFAETSVNPGSYGGGRLNVQGMLNSFNWTLDNRIQGATGPMGGLVRAAGPSTNKAIDLRGKDFSFDPRDLSKLRAETGGGQHGLTFDDTGRKFVCHNSSHIRLAMYEERYAGRNPFYAMSPALLDIPADGPAAEVFRISPEEPWRVLRTAWRVSGKVPGLIEGGGRSSGYFTSATGITIYRGNAFPAEFLGDAFIADVGSNLIHRKKLYPDGLALVAKRSPDEEKLEFIASRDLWFRPVQFANAPDGALYVADMYREVVEHPWSIPETIKKHLDLNSGNDRGRIYRIVPDNFKQPKLPRLGKASTAELVSTLAHSNGWHRDTAARLIYERQDKAAVPLLTNLVATSRSAVGRMHAWYALAGLNALSAEQLGVGFKDSDEAVRAHAVRLSERLAGGVPAVETQLQSLTSDPSARVRYQLAFTFGELNASGRAEALAQVIRRADPQDPWIRSAALSSLRSGAAEVFRSLSGASQIPDPGLDITLRELAAMIGAQNIGVDVRQVLTVLAQEKSSKRLLSLANALANGLERAGTRLETYSEVFAPIRAEALRVALRKSASENERVDAVTFLQHAEFAQGGPVLLSLLKPEEPITIQLAALRALARFRDPSVAPELIGRFQTFTPRLRAEALDVLITRVDRAVKLLEAVQSGRIRGSELSAAQIRALRGHADGRVQKLATQALGQPAVASREQVIYGFQPSLDLAGDSARGKAVYLERCASCHRSGKDGFQVGPDLVSVKTAGKEKLLISILDPNREVAPQYLAYRIETNDGDALLGVIGTENTASVALIQPNGKTESVLRSAIKRIEAQVQSVMPEGLEMGLSVQQMADLLEYISTAQ